MAWDVVIAIAGLQVYDKENYKRRGRIIVPANSSKIGKVKVQWTEPIERVGWIRATMLRDQETAKRIIINYLS